MKHLRAIELMTQNKPAWLLLGLFFVVITGQAYGQLLQGFDLPADQQAQAIPDPVDPPVAQTNWATGTYGAASDGKAVSEGLQPFGAHLFRGGFSGVRADGLNDTYRIMPGDQITLRLWGAVEVDRIMPVDTHGNVFIPSVGPVSVQGLPHSQLDAKVRAAVKTLYPENVNVYTNLQGVQPVAVFVSGYVTNPGRYAGTPNDSALYFLDQAGGIDAASGSYRQIRVVRNNRTIAEVDLYAFLLRGQLERPQFRDGDTIIVEKRGPAVSVVGDVAREQLYELLPAELNGAALLQLAQRMPSVSHVLQRGVRESGPISGYFRLDDFAAAQLHDGDELMFSADQRDETIVVQIEGSYYGPSRYVLAKDAMLMDLLDVVPVPAELTDTENVSLRRVSVAERQKASLEESLRRLETTYLGASSATPEEAQIRVREAELIENFVKRAALIEPTGRMVIAENGQLSNIRLQDGDVITIPERADSILVSGEVLMSRSLVYKSSMSAQDYIDRAGGFSEHADEERILVLRRSGDIRDAEDVEVEAGDEILVLPEVPTKNLQLASTISEIIYQIAIAARVAINI